MHAQRSFDRRAFARGRIAPLAAGQALRSAPVHSRAEAARTNPRVLRAFSGAGALALAANAFRDPNRDRFDPRVFRNTRFAGAYWPGPFFFPYAYYDETFWLWPSAYDDVFWSYGYDDVQRGIYSPYAYNDYDGFLGAIGGPVRRARGHQPATGNLDALCGTAAPGLTDWPVDDIVAAVDPSPEQRTLLEVLIEASDKAAGELRAACPRAVAVTPVGRLDAMRQQLAALNAAVRTVRPALEKFYGSLSDDQRERFNGLAPASRTGRGRRAAATPPADRLARACQAGEADLNRPIARIEGSLQLDQPQRTALDALRSATAEAARITQSACPKDVPLTPTGRIAAMESRTAALLEATGKLQPALAKFYASLTDEQKAQFNRALASDTRRAG